MRFFGWSLGLFPLGWMLYDFAIKGSGPNPVTEVIHVLGLWAMIFLLGSLAVRPFVQLGRLRSLLPWKKILGLLGFIYALLHALIYFALDQGLDWEVLSDDFTKRVHIRFGMIALLLLLPLAVTSNNRLQKALGRQWKTLHRLVFPAGLLVGLHYMLARKTGFDRASWALVIVLLLIFLRWKPIILSLQKLLAPALQKK